MAEITRPVIVAESGMNVVGEEDGMINGGDGPRAVVDTDTGCCSSDDGASTTENSNNNDGAKRCRELDIEMERKREEETMERARENRIVRRGRILMLLVLLLSMIGVALAVYYLTRNSEQRQLDNEFNEYADKILNSIVRSLALTFGAVDAYVVSMVSLARYTNQTWPFVTIPDFEIRSAKIRALSSAVFLAVYPLVDSDERYAWENYTRTHNYWLEESIDVQERDETYEGPIIRDYENYDVIHDYSEFDKEEPGKVGRDRRNNYLPVWQNSPVIPRFPAYNWDLLSSYDTSSIEAVLKSQNVVISEAYMIPDYGDPAQLAETEIFAEFFKDFIDPDEEPMEPVSDVYYPIIDLLDSVTVIDKNYSSSPDHVVGILGMSIYWRHTLKNTLPPGSDGFVVVFESACNPTFTYQINGMDAIYLGAGDLHNPKYDAFEVSSPINMEVLHEEESQHTYTGIPLNEEYCPFTVRVYPSILLESAYVTNRPIVFTVASILIFTFTSGVFLLYDHFVEKRQKKVVTDVVNSHINASELERLVKERTQKLEITNRRLEAANSKIRQSSSLQLTHFACMSHEIRTPLNAIIGLSSVLQDSSLNPAQRDSVQMVVSSGELLRAIVDDVLDFSKLESGKVVYDIKKCNLDETVNSVVYAVETRGVADKKRLTIRSFYESNVPEFIDTDRLRLQQILFNLLGNAVKFSKDGGTVEFSVSVPQVKQNQMLRLVVKDYGKGIEKDKFKMIFEPFLQATEEERNLLEHHGDTLIRDTLYSGQSVVPTQITSASPAGPNAYMTVDGSSMAAAHVAGVAAMYLEAHPTWTPEQVWEAMRSDAGAYKLQNIGLYSPNLLLSIVNLNEEEESSST